MLVSLKMSSLARKCVFYELEHNAKELELNFEGIEMQK